MRLGGIDDVKSALSKTGLNVETASVRAKKKNKRVRLNCKVRLIYSGYA